MKIIRPIKITKKKFSKFGGLIDTTKKTPININNGYAKRFHNLIKIDTSKKRKINYEYFFIEKKEISNEYKNDGKTPTWKPSICSNE